MRHLSAGLGLKSLSLLYTESVLLIGNTERKILILYQVSDKSMGSDDDICLTISYHPACFLLLLIRQSPGEKDTFYIIILHKAGYLLHVLGCQHLGRSHEGRLMTVPDSCQHRKKHHYGLAGTDISFYEPVHGMA